MAMLGQASGGFTESSSSLRLLHVGVRNTVGVLTDDAFTQTNPPVVSTAGTVSSNVPTTVLGVLGGSVAFSRPDAGSNLVGGNVEGLAVATQETFVRPLGVFLNNANGRPFENLPAQASGKGPYVSAQGTYANALFETQALATDGGDIAEGADLTYIVGAELIASRNGYLMPRTTLDAAGAISTLDISVISAEVEHGLSASTTIGILKMPADSTQNELVYDQRI